MKNKIKIVLLTSFLLLMAGCSSKSLFEPAKVAGYIDFDGTLPAPIKDVTRSGATLQNGQIISKKYGLMNVKIPKNYRFLSLSAKKVVSVSGTGKLLIQNEKGQKLYTYDFKNMIASAKLNKNILAIVFADNDLMVFNIKTNQVLFERKLDDAYALDARIANPYFLGSLIVFPTLDGRLLIVDGKTYTALRDMVISSKPYFNNVIFLSVLDNRLIAATQSKVISISPTAVSYLKVGVKDIVFLGQRVFVFTKNGRIILTTSNLKVLKERKFKFANFSTAIYGDFIYVIEKNGYLIAVDKNLITANVYKLPSEIEDLMFTTSNTFYYGDQYFKLSKIK